MKRILSSLLCIMVVIGLLPTMAFATDATGSGTEKDPYLYAVSTAEELTAAVNAINADTSDTSYYTISLQDDITTVGMSFNYNTTTILGNGHKLTFKNYDGAIHIGQGTTSHPVLILGKDKDNSLTIEGSGTGDTYFIGVGALGDPQMNGTLIMNDGVTITGAKGQNYYGGAVRVCGGGTFIMNGGTITECGIDGGSVCFGGGVAAYNGGVFQMNGGSIENCFLNTNRDITGTYGESQNLLTASGAGAGVFVANGGSFTMAGGEIKNNKITAKEGTETYGVGGGIAMMGGNIWQNYDGYIINSRVEITGGSIEGNHATLGGGGIAVFGMRIGPLSVKTDYETVPGLIINGSAENKVQIKNNTADGWVYHEYDGDVEQDYYYMVGGGGVLLDDLNEAFSVQINNAEISCNTVTNAPGGGIECLSVMSRFSTSFTIKNTVLTGNKATEGAGVCLYNPDGTMSGTFSDTIITGNIATGQGNSARGLGGGFSVETETNSAGEPKTAVTFDEGCAIYNNAADIGAADFYKDANSTVTSLPTAEQMSKAANVNITGWYHDREGSRYSENNAVKYTPVNSTTDELQLKAVTVVSHIVHFDTQDGSDVADQTVIDGKSAAEPADPAKSGYTFAGWYTDNTYETAYNFDNPVTQDIILYAKWSKNSSGGGSSSTTYYYFALEKIDAQDSHTLNGAKFGLYLDGKQIATATSDRNGIAIFRVNAGDYRKMTTESKLYYQELSAPEGYIVNSDKTAIKKSDLTTSQTAAEKKAETVRNYRSSTPDLLNGDDHFAYVIGYKDGCVRPYGQISRAETATIFFRLLKDIVRDDNLLTNNSFTDVTDDYWANTAISTMAGLGIVQGRSSTTFNPQASITRAEFAAICARFDTGTSSGSQTFSDISGHWAEKYIQRAAELGWIKGFTDGTFRPDAYITRAEAMTMINRVLNRIPEENGDLLANMNVWPDCTINDWFYLAVQEATNSHDFKHKAGNYETWTGMKAASDWTRYEN